MLHWISKTSTKKLGAIPVSYASLSSCPTTCKFHPNKGKTGCYAWANFRIKNVTKNIKKVRGFEEAMEEVIRKAKIVRHFISGDLVGNEEEVLKICKMVEEEYNMVNVGYTHTWKDLREKYQVFKKYFRASCENIQDVKLATSMGWTCELTVSDWSEEVMNDIKELGLVPTPCPEQKSGGMVDCNSCRLCSTEERNQRRVILLKAHKNKNVAASKIQY